MPAQVGVATVERGLFRLFLFHGQKARNSITAWHAGCRRSWLGKLAGPQQGTRKLRWSTEFGPIRHRHEADCSQCVQFVANQGISQIPNVDTLNWACLSHFFCRVLYTSHTSLLREDFNVFHIFTWSFQAQAEFVYDAGTRSWTMAALLPGCKPASLKWYEDHTCQHGIVSKRQEKDVQSQMDSSICLYQCLCPYRLYRPCQAMFAAIGIILAELYTGKAELLLSHLMSCAILWHVCFFTMSLVVYACNEICNECIIEIGSYWFPNSRTVLTRLASTLQRFEQFVNLTSIQCSCQWSVLWKWRGEGISCHCLARDWLII